MKVKTSSKHNLSTRLWSVAIPIPSYEGQDVLTLLLNYSRTSVAIPIPSYEGQDELADAQYPFLKGAVSQYLFLLMKVKTNLN